MPYREVSILLVEDDDIDAMGVQRALKQKKILNPVVRARNGKEGLELLQTDGVVRRPFVILLDLNMPIMNGLEMLAEIRKDPALSRSVIFVMTTSSADEDKMAAYSKHVAGYIVKSNVGEGFLNLIEMLNMYWRVVELPVDL